MATKIPLCIKGPPFKDPDLGSFRIYNPMFKNFYSYVGSNLYRDTATLGREFAKWGAIYKICKTTGEYILFKRDEDATMFLLRFS